MAMWRCPHCSTPQPESSRCWVCRRSSTCCTTCRHFRRSIAAQLGYCGLDRRREPLDGAEIRACWEATEPVTASVMASSPEARRPGHDRTPVRISREFVALEPAPEEARLAAVPDDTGDRMAVLAVVPNGPAGAPEWTLFPELEA